MASLNLLSKKKFLVGLYSIDHEAKQPGIFAHFANSLTGLGYIPESMTMVIINKISDHHHSNYYNNHNR